MSKIMERLKKEEQQVGLYRQTNVALLAISFLVFLPVSIKGDDSNSREHEKEDQTSWAQEARIWKNVLRETSGYDSRMKEIDQLISPGSLTDTDLHIRSLITRYDGVNHYKSDENLEFILKAIAVGTYPRYPAVDVLTRFWQTGESRRTQVKEWILALDRWALGESENLRISDKVVSTKSLLGTRTDVKIWLVRSLSKTLGSFVETPKDRVWTLNDEVFVRSLYIAALGREPSPDDLAYRIKELERGKERGSLIDEVYGSDEADSRRLNDIDSFSRKFQ